MPTNLDKALAERRKGELGLTNISTKVQSWAKIQFDLHQTEFFIEEADNSWQAVDEAHVKIATLEPDKQDDHSKEWNRLFDLYTTIKCELRRIRTSLVSTTLPVVPSSTRSEIKLPKINLATFSGKVHEWISFRDMYLTAIHNNRDLSDAQKFTYLKSSLTGNAAKLVNSLNITDANYPIAWDAVTKRFENKRELYFAIMKRFTALPIISNSSASSLRSIADAATECIRSVDTLCIQDRWDAILLFLLTQKLDSASKEQWELSLKDTEIPKSSMLLDFIEQRARSLAASLEEPAISRREHKKPVLLHARPGIIPSDGDCSFCSGAHFNFRCPKFIAMKIEERRALVQQRKCCFNCLRTGHRVLECPLDKSCKTCGRRHHSLLHPESVHASSGDEKSSQVHNHHSQGVRTSNHESLLATAVIRVKTAKGTFLQCRALLDGGSTVSCISEACMGKLGLTRERMDVEVMGLGSTHLGKTRGLALVQFKPYFGARDKEPFCIDAFILQKITCPLPTRRVDSSNWPHLRKLRLADPGFNIPADVEVLLGADIFFKLLQGKIRRGWSTAPDAINSRLGWLISGPTGVAAQPSIQIHHSVANLEESLNRFWSVEEVSAKTTMTREERDCEEDFRKTYSRTPEGRFVVHMPMKSPEVPLGASREMARKRLLQVEQRLSSRPELRSLYEDFMKQYESLGHMRKLGPENSSHQRIFIPHHCILKDVNQTMKFRVVFDASSKTGSGFSLNDAQMVGPVVQDTLYAIVMRFRIYQFTFVADIQKMYRQILLTPEQRNFQCILWRFSPDFPIQEYQLCTVTYGTASAPFLATRVLRQLGDEGSDRWPEGAAMLKRDFYMDDVMSGKHSIDDLKHAIDELRRLRIQ